jgi:hypothetical protein
MYPVPIISPVQRLHLDSARPDAPVVPDRPRRRPVRATRLAVAAALHAAARVVEPPRPRREVCA